MRQARRVDAVNQHSDACVRTGKQARNGEEIIKPEAVVYYNSSKQGIDVSDQLVSYPSAARKSVRWYHKVAVELFLGTAVVNAHKVYNDHLVAANMSAISITVFSSGSLLSTIFYIMPLPLPTSLDQGNTTCV